MRVLSSPERIDRMFADIASLPPIPVCRLSPMCCDPAHEHDRSGNGAGGRQAMLRRSIRGWKSRPREAPQDGFASMLRSEELAVNRWAVSRLQIPGTIRRVPDLGPSPDTAGSSARPDDPSESRFRVWARSHCRAARLTCEVARLRAWSMIAKKPGPDLIGAGYRFSEKPALGLDPRDHAPNMTSSEMTIRRKNHLALVHCRHVHLLGDRPAVIFGIAHARRQHHRRPLDLPVRHLAEQVADAVQPGALLVHSFHDPPRRLRNVRVFEHRLLGLGVLLPACP